MKSRGKGKVAGSFIPRRKAHDRDFLRIARESSEVEQDIQEKIAESAERQCKKRRQMTERRKGI